MTTSTVAATALLTCVISEHSLYKTLIFTVCFPSQVRFASFTKREIITGAVKF